MCGIAGIFAYRESAPPVDEQELLRIREHMIKRGPDGAGLWVSSDRRVGLAHRRLSIIDLSETGAQPMATADANFRITFNGEIYNYRELRRELESKGYAFRSTSDTEVLLHLYANRGVDMVHALRGMYAFAIWDQRRKGVFVARDPFGIKPLYYADDGSTIRVASQVKALLKGGAIDTAPEPAGHVGFFLWGHVPEPYTLYRGIRSLEAGTSLWIGTGGEKEKRRFFSVSEEIATASATRLSVTREEMHERLRAALRDSVHHHMIADVPVGLFLSAGLDSSTLTALATETENTDLRTITLGFREFRGTSDDEVPLAEIVAKHYGSIHETRWIAKEDFHRARLQFLDAMDQPSTDAVNSYFISKVAAEAGLKVAMSGLGGDELFGGYPSFRQIPIAAKVLGPFQIAPFIGKGFRILSAPILRQFTSPKYASLFEFGSTYESAYLLRRGMFMPWELVDVLDGDMVRQGWRELKTTSCLQQSTHGISNARLKITALETIWYMRNQLLRDADWASMAHAIEIRVPLVDIELFRATVPLLNSTCAPGKMSMAATPLKPLPVQIMRRKKTGFSVPLIEWLTPSAQTSNFQRGLRNWAAIVYRESTGRKSSISGEALPIALIFRTGQLGDTLVALPAIEWIRKSYPKHQFILLTDRHKSIAGHVSSWDICKSTGWFDRVIFYEPGNKGWPALRIWLSLLIELRNLKVDELYNLAPGRSKRQAIRDSCYFRYLAGTRNYHTSVPTNHPTPTTSHSLPCLEPEWRLLLRNVSADEPKDLAFRLPIQEPERESALQVALAAGISFGKRLLAVGPGSKMPAKKWPIERFAELGTRILGQFSDLQIVVLGGSEDVTLGHKLCAKWGEKSHNLAGKLSVYGSASILEKCIAYVGNDTGTMHLAAMSGTPCVAIFSARDNPGKWAPYGKGHAVLRHEVECAGCMLEVCEKYDNKCLKLISVEEVYAATRRVIESMDDAVIQ